MKRNALCLYGRFNNKYSKSSGLNGFQYILKNLLKKNELELFIFTNDIDNKAEILECYESFATEINFGEDIDWNRQIRTNGIDLNHFSPIETNRTLPNSLNFLYSRGKSIESAVRFGNRNREEFEWIIASRFDLAQIDKYNGYQPFRVSEINFNPWLPNDYLYTALWNQTNAGIADQWIFGSQANMTKLINMAEIVIDYFKPNSEYLNWLVQGINFSNQQNPFSNEIFHQFRKSKHNLAKVATSRAIDNHLIHKYYFLGNGLLEKNRHLAHVSNTARVLYTHTDYSDCWPMYFGQTIKVGNLFAENYVFVNKIDDRIPKYFKQILYDDALDYSDRVLSCLQQLSSEVIFFEHEDMILYDVPEVMQLINYVALIKKNVLDHFNPNRFDAIKLARGGKFYCRKVRKRGIKSLRAISRLSPWIFSIQPSFWSRDSLIDLLSRHKRKQIWKFERDAQKTIRNMRFRVATVFEKTPKRGAYHYDSTIYPFIATAIVKGKWNTLEYERELTELSAEFNINLDLRGTNQDNEQI